ncbi:unnamed protein product [Ambrosiozyma monospora]|uniref:Unnamed protein product n=1 Tax=Ambrosiozyma monospora TaxID=43982 RepID=A0ACB5SXG7_AMBMO|nr:unnamed protein product [Ambrosiozyma monospora]
MHGPGYLDRYLGEYCLGSIMDLPVKPKKKKMTTKKSSSDDKESLSYQHALTKFAFKAKSKKQKLTQEEKEEQERLKNAENKPPLGTILSINDFEYVAKKVLPPMKLNYFNSGSDDELTLRENRRALSRIFFRPRCLIDVSKATTSTSILGVPTSAPFYIGSITGSELIQGEGEFLLTKAAIKEDIMHIIPQESGVSLDDITHPDHCLFYQYRFKSRKEVEDAPKLFAEIEKQMPQVKAIFLNSHVVGLGNTEKANKTLINSNSKDDEVSKILKYKLEEETTPTLLTWSDFEKIRNSTNVPIVIKGLQRKEDIVKACELGFQGAIISNDGGRQLDSSLSTIEILYQTRQLMNKKQLSNKKDFELFVEGGFRRGSDILKALCLGAKPGLGRGILYSEVYGQEGVEKAVRILKTEILRDMKLLGVNHVDELNENFLDTSSLDFRFNVNGGHDDLYNKNYTPMLAPHFKKA